MLGLKTQTFGPNAATFASGHKEVDAAFAAPVFADPVLADPVLADAVPAAAAARPPVSATAANGATSHRSLRPLA
jgi:hypothetical protein